MMYRVGVVCFDDIRAFVYVFSSDTDNICMKRLTN